MKWLISDELKRLTERQLEKDLEGYFLININVRCNEKSDIVIEKVKQVLNAIFNMPISATLDVEALIKLLPDWFIVCFSPEIDKALAEELMKTQEGYIRLSKMWTFTGFIYWFRPENRTWYWWDSFLVNDDFLVIRIATNSYPITIGALEFLLKSAGAEEISFEQ